MPMCELAAQYGPPVPTICLRGALEARIGVYHYRGLWIRFLLVASIKN
jgi:hypothetical protein